jgi:hypothetical protein
VICPSSKLHEGDTLNFEIHERRQCQRIISKNESSNVYLRSKLLSMPVPSCLYYLREMKATMYNWTLVSFKKGGAF